MQAFLIGLVTTLAGLVMVALWALGRKMLAALVEIGRLPDVVTDLRNAIDDLRVDLAGRVERLESYLPESLRVTVDVTNQPEGVTP